MAEEMFIFSTGFNGSAVYSLYTKEGKQPIITKKAIEEISKEIIRIYPDIAKKISDFYYMDFSGSLPSEMDMSTLNPSNKADLIKTIATNLKKINKV
ncbi:MAG TPA: hypothetical protein VK153_01720 [Candidatus Paceibacterota bacterium]|nr:hypothetical protein [Candidatus Paceibacterota bacterium]